MIPSRLERVTSWRADIPSARSFITIHHWLAESRFHTNGDDYQKAGGSMFHRLGLKLRGMIWMLDLAIDARGPY